jgi:hypothetical protein
MLNGANLPHPTTFMANKTQEMPISLIAHAWPGMKFDHTSPLEKA